MMNASLQTQAQRMSAGLAALFRVRQHSSRGQGLCTAAAEDDDAEGAGSMHTCPFVCLLSQIKNCRVGTSLHAYKAAAGCCESLQHQEGCEAPIMTSTLPGDESPAGCCDHLLEQILLLR